MQSKQQQQEVRHMNSALTTTLFPFMKAQASAGKPVSRRAQPPEKWSFRVDMPLVRESVRDVNNSPVRARTPADIAALCDDIRQSAQEAFLVFDLNAKNNVIDKRLVTIGLLDASLVHPREVFRGAILNNAAAVVVVHNHPSGDPTPSAEDIRITRQLVEASRILGVKVLDHVIIGRPGATAAGSPAFLSLRESGVVNFTE
jgi:DNA repair protein RadC